MKQKLNHEALLHYTLSFIGGFLGLYSILSRCELFGSAQTGNLLYLVRDILGANFSDFLFRIGALVLYAAAIALTVWLPERFGLDLKMPSILIDGAVILMLGFFPEDMNPVLGLYPVFFAMAFQWCSFRGACGYVSSTTFSTNNLRQFTTATTQFLIFKEKEYLQKARFFGITLLAFHAGAAVSYALWSLWRIHSVWCCLIPLTGALMLAFTVNCPEKEFSRNKIIPQIFYPTQYKE